MGDESVKQRMDEAQIYLAQNHIKELYAKLVYEVTLYRVNEPIDYFVSRLKDIEQHGLEHSRSYPRVYFVLGETRELQAYCYRQLCEKFRMRYVNISAEIQDKQNLSQSVQSFIEKEMKETDNIDFVLDNFPPTIKEAIEFEKSFIECRLALYVEDEQIALSDEERKNLLVLKQYYGALHKLKEFKLVANNAEATVVEIAKLFE